MDQHSFCFLKVIISITMNIFTNLHCKEDIQNKLIILIMNQGHLMHFFLLLHFNCDIIFIYSLGLVPWYILYHQMSKLIFHQRGQHKPIISVVYVMVHLLFVTLTDDLLLFHGFSNLPRL